MLCYNPINHENLNSYIFLFTNNKIKSKLIDVGERGDGMAATRIGRRNRKKKKSRIRFLTVMLVLFVAIVGFTIWEFQSGYERASGDDNIPLKDSTKSQTKDFNGQDNELGKVNVLLLGVDTSEDTKARTDTIMIAQYDPENRTAKIASIMRDSYVSIPGYSNNKINSAFYYGGAELLRKTIKENFGIDVEYYALVNFDGFTDLIDVVAPDGIKIDVEKKMRYVDNAGGVNIHLDPGLQALNGEELLDYARFRHDREGDFGRVRRQQQVISAVKDQMISVKGLIKVPRLLGTVMPYIHTNMSKTKMVAIGTDFLLDPIDNIETLRIPMDGTYSLKSYPNAGSVVAMDKEENRNALQEFFKSSNLSDEQTAATTKKQAVNKKS